MKNQPLFSPRENQPCFIPKNQPLFSENQPSVSSRSDRSWRSQEGRSVVTNTLCTKNQPLVSKIIPTL